MHNESNPNRRVSHAVFLLWFGRHTEVTLFCIYGWDTCLAESGVGVGGVGLMEICSLGVQLIGVLVWFEPTKNDDQVIVKLTDSELRPVLTHCKIAFGASLNWGKCVFAVWHCRVMREVDCELCAIICNVFDYRISGRYGYYLQNHWRLYIY